MAKLGAKSSRRVTPDELLARMGVTPADNREGYGFVVPWKSKIAGGVVRSMVKWNKVLASVSENPLFGPCALAAYWQRKRSVLRYSRRQARAAALS